MTDRARYPRGFGLIELGLDACVDRLHDADTAAARVSVAERWAL
jgi:hypothetical protein